MKAIKLLCIAAVLASCTTINIEEQQIGALYNRMSQQERIAQLRSMYMDTLFNEPCRVGPAH